MFELSQGGEFRARTPMLSVGSETQDPAPRVRDLLQHPPGQG